MSDRFRHNAAIIHEGRVLLVQHHFFDNGARYWVFPGGCPEPGESSEETVAREAREETGLEVRVEQLLIEEWTGNPGKYQGYRTYRCSLVSGTAQLGYEPEREDADRYEIAAVRWVDLRDESGWGADISENPVTGRLLRTIRARIGEDDAINAR